ncbi:MAG: Fe-S cluster assembly sulfur transfer protein SufU [Steroidobacteraceae bacterium]|jgi:nitrogen fixation NifU-like protein
MTREVDGLYRGVVLEHCKRPRNFRVPQDANHRACGDNPLCGDRIEVHVRLERGAILDIAFSGEGCAVAKASASLMTEAMMGRDTGGSRALLSKFEQMVGSAGPDSDPELGELRVFADVREFPSRVQCALLAWDALRTVLTEAGCCARHTTGEPNRTNSR